MSNARVVSIRDIPYELPVNTSYAPVFQKAAAKRMLLQLESILANHPQRKNLVHVFKHAVHTKAARHVWAIVVESDQTPVFVAKNLMLAKTSLMFRRVLLVRI